MLQFVGDWLPVSIDIQNDRQAEGLILVGNLECAIGHDPKTNTKAYSVVLPFSTLNIIRESPFTALSVANNHVYDAGPDSFNRMLYELESNGKPNIYGTKQNPQAELSVNGNRVAIIGCLEKCRSRGPQIFREEDVAAHIRGIRSDYDLVFVTPHWGKEGEYAFYPSPRQVILARKWIDVGADGIFGHHTHVFQGYESYKSKPIYYSLGNFFYPQEESVLYPMTNIGLCVRIDDNNSDHFYLQRIGECLRILNPTHLESVDEHIRVISQELCQWSPWKWARKVGPICISKSNQSWNMRFKNNFWKTLPLWCCWNLLYGTLLMRIGSWFPDRDSKANRKKLVEALYETAFGSIHNV